MGYPETAEGFMIEDQKKWTSFKKQEVRSFLGEKVLLIDSF